MHFTSPLVDIKNNIFTNSRGGGTGRHYAIANGYPAATSSALGWAANASDYNVLNSNANTIGYWSGDQTFAGWKAASAADAHSLSNISVTYNDSASDLHLVPSANAAVDGKAIPIAGIATDFDNQARNATNPDIGADEFTPTGAMAVNFEYLKGNRQGSLNILNWKAGCSSNSVNFDMERSADARRFVSIGNTTATRARCLQPFDFTDNLPLNGTNYYRLKITEIDGLVSYSPIIAILNRQFGVEIVGLFPTLINNGKAILSVSSAQSSNIKILVTDISGKLMQQQTSVLSQGSNTINLNFERLAAGSYLLTSYTAEGKISTLRFAKQ